jgi:hypothetical protein
MKIKILTAISITAAFFLSSCNKEKQVTKYLDGEWEVTSFLRNADDLTQLYKDSCGCRLIFHEIIPEIKGLSGNKCLLKCSYNNWNYYYYNSLTDSLWRSESPIWTWYDISDKGNKINWSFGYKQPDSIYRWGMYPLTIRKKGIGKTFSILERSKKNLSFMFQDSLNDTYIINFSKIK